MLELIRKNAQGIIIWIIVGLVILGLSSFMLTSYVSDNIKNYVAKVNDTEISNNDYQVAYNNYQQRLQQSLGENFGRFFNEELMRESVISGLVNNELITQLTHDAGFRAGPAQILNEITRNPSFKGEDGKFSADRYEKLLRQIGYSKQAYEAEIAQFFAQQQFSSGVKKSVFVLPDVVDEFVKLEQQQRDISYLQVSKTELMKTVSVSKEEIQDYYDKNRHNYMTPEQVKLAYIELDLKAIAKNIDIDDEELKHYYDKNKAAYTKDDYSGAEKKIKDIEKRLNKGESFEKLAKELSQDPGSAAKGGDLGFFARGVMAKEFEAATFSLKKGKVSKPVKTQFGYHLIKLEEIRGQERRARHILIKPEKTTQTFTEVKARILNEMQHERAEKRFYEDADKLDRLAYEHPDSLEPVIEALGLGLKESPYFPRTGGPGLWQNPDVIKAAFGDAVFRDGLNSELIKITDDHILVVRLKDHKPAAQKPLDTVSKQIELTLRNDKASAQANEMANKLLVDLRAGKSMDELLKDSTAIMLSKPGFIGRRTEFDPEKKEKQAISAEIRKTAFATQKPADNKPVYNQLSLQNGDAVVLMLHAVRDHNSNGKQIEAVKRHLTDQIARSADGAMLEYMRSHSEIDYNKQQDENL